MPLLNDVHSQLNATAVAAIYRPRTVADIQELLHRARAMRQKVSVSGGRHAMGGQQFASNAVHLDMTAMHQVLQADATQGLLHMEAGAMWPEIIAATRAMATSQNGHAWAIRQKQTGVDQVTLGGSMAVNAHGRGLNLQPMCGDIESLEVLLPDGTLLTCNRQTHADLFSLVLGGYGLCGIVTSATLRLTPRLRVRRLVDILDLEDAQAAIWRRVEQGCVYGDFQFVIDANDPRFLTRGVLACYEPVTGSTVASAEASSELPPQAWLELLHLAYTDKAAAFRRYAQHYLGTHGQVYDADTMQLATYLPDYAKLLESCTTDAPGTKESLIIGEHYVPYENITAFMRAAQKILRDYHSEVIYGTIRAIRQDDVSALPWAQQDSACVIFNLRTSHTPQGLHTTASTFRALIDAAIQLGGSYYLCYHRFATAAQLRQAHPQIDAFAKMKKAIDPHELLSSNWWRHITAQLAS